MCRGPSRLILTLLYDYLTRIVNVVFNPRFKGRINLFSDGQKMKYLCTTRAKFT